MYFLKRTYLTHSDHGSNTEFDGYKNTLYVYTVLYTVHSVRMCTGTLYILYVLQYVGDGESV